MDVTETAIDAARQADRPYRTSFPAFELGRHYTPGEDLLLGLNLTSLVPTAANGYARGNYPRYSNPQWDALSEKYATTIPYTERLQVIKDMSRFMFDQLFDMMLFDDTGATAISNRFVHTGTANNQGWDAQTWDVK